MGILSRPPDLSSIKSRVYFLDLDPLGSYGISISLQRIINQE